MNSGANIGGETPLAQRERAGGGKGNAEAELLELGLQGEFASGDRAGGRRSHAAEHPDSDQVHDAGGVGEGIASTQFVEDEGGVKRAFPEVIGGLRVELGGVATEVGDRGDFDETHELAKAEMEERLTKLGDAGLRRVEGAVACGDDPGGEGGVGAEELGDFGKFDAGLVNERHEAGENARPAGKFLQIDLIGKVVAGHYGRTLIGTPDERLSSGKERASGVDFRGKFLRRSDELESGVGAAVVSRLTLS